MAKLMIVAALAMAAPTVTASAQSAPVMLTGKCAPQSQLGVGSSEANLDEQSTPFRCDSAVITFPAYKRVLIHFFLKADRRAHLIGFAGDAIEGGEVDVDHLYLNDGRTLEVTKGHCQTWFRASGSIKSIVCGARVERGDIAVATVIGFDTFAPVRRTR